MVKQSDLLTTTALAKELKLSRQWVHQLIKIGKIEAVRLSNNRLLIEAAEAKKVRELRESFRSK